MGTIDTVSKDDVPSFQSEWLAQHKTLKKGQLIGVLEADCSYEAYYNEHSLRPVFFEAVFDTNSNKLLWYSDDPIGIYQDTLEDNRLGGIPFSSLRNLENIRDAGWDVLNDAHPLTGSLMMDSFTFLSLDGHVYERDDDAWVKMGDHGSAFAFDHAEISAVKLAHNPTVAQTPATLPANPLTKGKPKPAADDSPSP